MIFKVSVFKRGKSGPVITEVAEVLADRFIVGGSDSPFTANVAGISFFNDERKFIGADTETLVAFLPGHDWVIKQA